jgi:hypothetical protein
MLELCKFHMKSYISHFGTQIDCSTKPFVEMEEPHMRLVGPWPYGSYYGDQVPVTGYLTRISQPCHPWTKSYFKPLPISTGNPCVDLLLFAGPGDLCLNRTYYLLDLAWNHNPLTTLKIILYMPKIPMLRAHQRFHRPLLWLYHKHYKTLACNLRSLAECGYLKQLPLLLLQLLYSHTKFEFNDWDCCMDGSDATLLRAYYGDDDYRFIYNEISDLISELLKSDLEFLKSGDLHKISLAAKFCPSLNTFFDYGTLMCESISRRLFPQDLDPIYKKISGPHYAYRVRDRLCKEVIAPLRRALISRESYIPAGEAPIQLFKETRLTHSKDTQHNKALLISCTRDRNMNFKNRRVRKYANTRIPVDELLPHKILGSLYDGRCAECANLQWKKMIEHLTMKGKFTNCLACCDVSPSMTGFCTTVSIALGLLISDLSQGPWRGKIMTFSHDPRLQKIEGIDLQSRTDFMETIMDWGLGIDLRKVFLHILEVAVKENIDKDKMVKTIFVFTSMEFNETFGHDNWNIDYQKIRNKFYENGYTTLPVVVFWNLSRHRHGFSSVREFNVLKKSGYTFGLGIMPNGPRGVIRIKGFSNELLRLAIENNGVMDPNAIMEMVISDKRYEKVTVCD